jgi:hypothetical protein
MNEFIKKDPLASLENTIISNLNLLDSKNTVTASDARDYQALKNSQPEF